MQDGVDHINIYSKGETELGKYLSNFAYTPFIHPFHGKFNSIEGYWYWDLTGADNLRNLYDYKAKEVGRFMLKEINTYPRSEWKVSKQSVKLAILCKLTQNEPQMLRQFIESSLPFRHYYNYSGKIVEPEQGKWIIEFFEDLRKMLTKDLN